MSKFKANDKIYDAISMAINPKVALITHEGTIRASKTAVAIQEFFYGVQDSDEILHCIAATDLDAIRENILNSEIGLLTLFGKHCTLQKDKIGSYFVEVKSKINGVACNKRVLLVGYSDSKKWEKILGKTIGTILIDEVNIANKTFIDECFARQVSVKNPLMIWTLNGDAPTHPIYTDYINRCKPIGRVPLSILNDMSKYQKQDGWYYLHWTMYDNPIMDNDKIMRASSIYPIGSYYYKTKILGERGTAGKLIYNEYMSEELIEDFKEKIFSKYIVGIDIGGNGATNCISLLGFTRNYETIAIIDKVQFHQCGYDEKKKIIVDTITAWKNQSLYIECISVDCAESNFIRDLKIAFIPFHLEVIGSYKATIKERIDMGVILLSSKRLRFNDTKPGRDAFQCFMQCVWTEGKEGIERQDLNLPLNDAIDSIEYALTVHMKEILLTLRKEY